MADDKHVIQPTRSTSGPLTKDIRLSDAFSHPEFMSRIKQAVPKHMSADRMMAVFIQSVRKTPKLADVDVLSLLGAFISLASVGLEPNTALNHAYLIPFDKREKDPSTGKWEVKSTSVQVIFGYQGIVELVYRSGLLRSVHCDVVWPHDDNEANFRYHYGTGGELFHRPSGEIPRLGVSPRYAYMHAALKGDAEMYEVMTATEVEAIRNSSQGYITAMRTYESAKKNGYSPGGAYTEAPWIKHPVPMWKKTAMRGGSKWLPKSIELSAALQLEDLQDRAMPNYRAVTQGAANVLTGLDALPDDYTGRDEPDFGNFSMQSERPSATAETTTANTSPPPSQQQQEQPQPARRGRPPKDRTAQQDAFKAPVTTSNAVAPAAPVQTVASTKPSTPSQGADFSQWVVDQYGEMVQDDPFTDPISFAYELRAQAHKATDLAAYLEINAFAMEAAEQANSVARGIIKAVRDMKQDAPASNIEDQQANEEGAQEDGQSLAIPLTESRGSPAWPLYQKAVKESLAKLEAPFIDAWAHENVPTISKAPASFRIILVNLAITRARELGVSVPPSLTEMISPAPAALTEDEVYANQTMQEMRNCKTIDELLSLARNEKVREKIKTLPDVLQKKLGYLSLELHTELQGKQDAEQAAEDGDPGYDPEERQ